MSSTPYQRHSADFWKTTVAEFHQSTLSGSAFCKQKGIAYASFCKWRQKLQPVTPASDPLTAVSRMPEEERKIVKALLEGMIVKYQTKQLVGGLSS